MILFAFGGVAGARGSEGARQRRQRLALSQAVRRLQLGVRLFHRTTRSVVLTEAGQRLLERLGPALGEVAAALVVVDGFRDIRRHAAPERADERLASGAAAGAHSRAFPDIQLDIVAEDGFVDLVASGCDAGIRQPRAAGAGHGGRAHGPRDCSACRRRIAGPGRTLRAL